eukprot:5742148-Amphidinium_carterae.2
MEFTGTNRSAVVQWLLASLAPRTQQRYQLALQTYFDALVEAGIRWEELDLSSQDWTLAEYILVMKECGLGRSAMSTLVSALQKAHPEKRYKISWKVLDAWARKEPSVQAPALPIYVCMALVTALHVSGHESSALALLWCFSGLLRIGEALALSCADVLVDRTCVVLILQRSKRGVQERIDIADPLVARWTLSFARKWPAQVHEPFLGRHSYSLVRTQLDRIASALGLANLHVTTHSFRRSGASHLHKCGIPIADILLRGRWVSVSTAKEYVRRGDVAALELSASLPPALQECFSATAVEAEWERSWYTELAFSGKAVARTQSVSCRSKAKNWNDT